MNPTIVLPLSAAIAAGHRRAPSLGIIASALPVLPRTVVPAKAGTHRPADQDTEKLIPAFARMTA
jgi:hypothetical protein